MKKITKLMIVFTAMTMMTLSFAGCNNNSSAPVPAQSQVSVPSTLTSEVQESSVESSEAVVESSVAESGTEESSSSESSSSGFKFDDLFGGDSSEVSALTSSGGSSDGSLNAMLKEYFASDEGKKALDEFSQQYSSDEFDAKLYYEDDVIVVELKAKQYADLSAFTSSELENLFDQSIQSEMDSQNAQSQFAMLASYGVTMKARVLNADGTVVYDKVIVSPDSSFSSSSAPSTSSVPSVSVSPSSGKTIRDYYNNYQSQFESLEKSLSSSSQSMKIYPDGDDTIVFECQILQQDIAPSSEVTALFKQQFDQQRSNFNSQAATIKKEAGVDRLTLTVKYLNKNGELLYSENISA